MESVPIGEDGRRFSVGMADDDEELFGLGTQVQAGVDLHRERERTRREWRARLSGYALPGGEVMKGEETGVKGKREVVRRVGKGGGEARGRGKNGGLKGQRLFKSINRETIRALTEGDDGGSGDDGMQRVYSEEEWAEVHGRIVESLPRTKRLIQWEEGDGGAENEQEWDHWASPSLCAAEADALYDGGVVEEANTSVCGVSGVFTLSQVLGERDDECAEEKPVVVVSDSSDESYGVITRQEDDTVVVEEVVEVDNTSEEAEVIVLSDSDSDGDSGDSGNSIQGNDVTCGVRKVLANTSLWMDVITYQPVSVRAVSALMERPESEVRDALDKLGVCWIE